MPENSQPSFPDRDFERFVATARRISGSVDPEFRETVFDRQVQAFFARPLAARRALAAAHAHRTGGDVQAAVDTIQLDPAIIPTLQP